MNKGDEKMVDVFRNRCLRRIFRICWQDHVSTEMLLERSRMKTQSEEIKWRRWKMIGHIMRQDRNNHCNIALTWASEGKRRRTRPKPTWIRKGTNRLEILERSADSSSGLGEVEKLCEGLMCHEA